MDLSKKRRENNTKRVGSAIRGNEWPLNKESVHVIPRTADKVEPKKPESGSPKPKRVSHLRHLNDYGDHHGNREWDTHTTPKPKPIIHSTISPKTKPRNPSNGDYLRGGNDDTNRDTPSRRYDVDDVDDDKPYGGSPVKPKPKPKSPSDPASKEIPTIKKHSSEYNKH
jgi:hypothetical protein